MHRRIISLYRAFLSIEDSPGPITKVTQINKRREIEIIIKYADFFSSTHILNFKELLKPIHT